METLEGSARYPIRSILLIILYLLAHLLSTRTMPCVEWMSRNRSACC